MSVFRESMMRHAPSIFRKVLTKMP